MLTPLSEAPDSPVRGLSCVVGASDTLFMDLSTLIDGVSPDTALLLLLVWRWRIAPTCQGPGRDSNSGPSTAG